MSDRAVRVVFAHVEEPKETMTLDLVLAGQRIKGGQEYFGVWEDKTENIRCPFVLTANGQIDYGYGHEDDDQFYGTDVLDKNFGIGEQITCSYEDDEYDYKIVSITPLP